MRLGVLREQLAGEKRVALVPADVSKLTNAGFDVVVERGAGSGSSIDDDSYSAAGASLVQHAEAVGAPLVVSVRGPRLLLDAMAAGGGAAAAGPIFVGVFDPLWDRDTAAALAEAGVASLALDLVPRITRAQSMDVLSSMATVAGYQAVLTAAVRLPQMFPLMMTAAGTLQPARVLVLGAGVAGLQALATARRLGAIVEGYDVRPAALEQIRSMGARAVELDLAAAQGDAGGEGEGGYARRQGEEAAALQRELLTPHVAAADVLITTAAVPGVASPLLVTTEMVAAMSAGSVIVDLAAERGGNCEPSQADTEQEVGGVTVLAPTDLPSRSARHASQMFSHNLTQFLSHLAPEGNVDIDTHLQNADEITTAMLVTHRGAVVHPRLNPDGHAATESPTSAEGAAAEAAATDGGGEED